MDTIPHPGIFRPLTYPAAGFFYLFLSNRLVMRLVTIPVTRPMSTSEPFVRIRRRTRWRSAFHWFLRRLAIPAAAIPTQLPGGAVYVRGGHEAGKIQANVATVRGRRAHFIRYCRERCPLASVPKATPVSSGAVLSPYESTLKPLDQQTSVLTGASSGIGLCTARMAAEQGDRLVLAARSEDALRQLCDEVTQREGQAVYVVADVSNRDDVSGP